MESISRRGKSLAERQIECHGMGNERVFLVFFCEVVNDFILFLFLFFTHTHCILFLQEINRLTPSIVNG